MKRDQPTYRHPIDPSEMDTVISLLPEPTETRTPGGSHTLTEGAPIDVRAKIEFGVPNESVQMDRLTLNQSLTATIRNQGLDTINERWEMKMVTQGGEEKYNIEGIKRIGRDTLLELYCSIVQN